MKLEDVFKEEGLVEFYETYEIWNKEQNLNFGIEDEWEFTPAEELEGDGIYSAYIATWAGEQGVLVNSTTGWDYYPTGYAVWTPMEFFSEAGQKLLKELGFTKD